jgi:hypothetical protein
MVLPVGGAASPTVEAPLHDRADEPRHAYTRREQPHTVDA